MRLRVENRSTEGQQSAVVEGISRFPGAGGAVRHPRERRDTRENGEAGRRRQCVRERFYGDGV
eukprot:4096619-Pleurochrysis_carterae.AAC.1